MLAERKVLDAHLEQLTAVPKSLTALHSMQLLIWLEHESHDIPLFFLNVPSEHVLQVLLSLLQVKQEIINSLHIRHVFLVRIVSTEHCVQIILFEL